MKKKLLFIANWKSYIESPQTAMKMVGDMKKRLGVFSGHEIVYAVPFPLISSVMQATAISTVMKVGAQTVSAYEGGAHTGDVSAQLLKQMKVPLAIIGHSERRAAGESDTIVRAQVARASAAGLRMVLCVGETTRDESGAHFEVLSGQIRDALADIPKTSVPKLVVAYEPVWAIGKSASEAMDPASVREAVIFMRKVLADLFGRDAALKVPLLYGGSVDASNARGFIDGGDVSGLLIGRASTNAESFATLVRACVKKEIPLGKKK